MAFTYKTSPCCHTCFYKKYGRPDYTEGEQGECYFCKEQKAVFPIFHAERSEPPQFLPFVDEDFVQ